MPINITAIIHVRNAELNIHHCIRHLIEQGVKIAIIDNESTDGTLDICREYYPEDVILIDTVPYAGSFDLHTLLVRVHEIRKGIDADWIVYQGDDEMLESNNRRETLREAIERIDGLGYNIINFDEFVFVPEGPDKKYEGTDYYRKMRYYYFFEPFANRLMRAFSNKLEIDNIDSGGHSFLKGAIKQYEQNLVLRHYICLSMEHFRRKYGSRVFSQQDLERGWHNSRANVRPDDTQSPAMARLEKLGRYFNRATSKRRPETRHFWHW